MVAERLVITDAAPSFADDQARRRRVYVILMLVHIVGFALSYPLYLWVWWAGVTAVVLTGVLPWVSVILANDAPRRFRGRRAQGPPGLSRAPATGSRRSRRPSPSR